MNNRPILFIDSGIGGLPYCTDFKNRNPQEEVYYLADRLNFPYGPRKKEELLAILIKLIENIIVSIDPKIIVIACNSATISALDFLRQRFPEMPFVGTVPAIKPAAGASETGKVGVLGTARTIEDPYTQHIAQTCENRDGIHSEIFGIAAPELVEFVEQRFDIADEKEKTEIVKKYIETFRAAGVDTLVLGCTHFLYLLDEFRKEAGTIKVFESLEGVTKRIEFLLDENDSALRTEKDFKPFNRLIVSGDEPLDSVWEKRANLLGLKSNLLKDI